MNIEEKVKAYDEALERAKSILNVNPSRTELGNIMESIFPELRESEDERARKAALEGIEYLERKLGWDAIGDTDILDVKEYLEKQKDAFENGRQLGIMQEQARQELEWPDGKQKDQKPVISDEAIGDGVVRFGSTQYQIDNWLKKHINIVEQKPAERIEDSVKFEEGFKAGRESGLLDGQKYVLNNLDSYGLCKPAEWSEEDEKMLKSITNDLFCGTDFNMELKFAASKKVNWLKNKLNNLRPQLHWKPKKELLDALHTAAYLREMDFYGGLKDKLRELDTQLRERM